MFRFFDKDGNGGNADTEVIDAATSTEDTKGVAGDDAGDGDGGADTESKQTDPVLRKFEELGLSRQYASPEAVLEAVPEMRRHIGELSGQMSTLQRQLNQLSGEHRKPVDTQSIKDQFEADPVGTIEKLVNKIGTLEQEVIAAKQDRSLSNEERSFDNLVVACAEISDPEMAKVAQTLRMKRKMEPGQSRVWDAMIREFNTNPAFEHLRNTPQEYKAIPALYKIVVGKPPVSKVSPEKKAAGTTAGGANREAGAPKVNATTMTVKQIEEYRVKYGKLPPA